MLEKSWELIQPAVNAEAEFLEILNDFGDPLELLREAISNAVDAGATWTKIDFRVRDMEGNSKLEIHVSDNGMGMTREILSRDFWGLGFSSARGNKDSIGEKGHGTKIFLRSEGVQVRTQGSTGAFESEVDRPLSALSQKRLHQPRIKEIELFLPAGEFGTEIIITGYNANERSKFVQSIVKDYLLWFTKLGSIECEFAIDRLKDFRVFLRCIDRDEFEEIPFGHRFPDERSDIDNLFEERGASAADWYAKKFVWRKERLDNFPEVVFDVIISVEGDEVKRAYNPMISERRRSDKGLYRVSDRYGIWLCKDYIPVTRVNDWISGFGSGSNAYVLLHGFVNCQSLRLTANRGDIANTDPRILQELKVAVEKLIDVVDQEIHKKGVYTLRQWQAETLTLGQEQTDFKSRLKSLRSRKVARIGDRLLVEPRNEAELFGLFMIIYTLYPQLFEFEPLDYNTTRGIDLIARNKSGNTISEKDYWYVELKHSFQTKRFNHAFEHLRWIVFWEFDKGVIPGMDFCGIVDSDIRKLKSAQGDDGFPVYFLDSPGKARKIQLVPIKELLKLRLGIEFQPPGALDPAD